MLHNFDIESLDWEKQNGLVPAVIQDSRTRDILMLGYMNNEALTKTLETGKITFFARTKQRLWVKGETSGNFLTLVSIAADCDNDTLLIKAIPSGPTCHTGKDTCFGDKHGAPAPFSDTLQDIIKSRKTGARDESYVASLFKDGAEKIAQKVGEEGVEVALAHVTGQKDKTVSEAADLLFHLMVLLEDADLSLQDVYNELEMRHKKT